jgi:hypothetical protein
MPVKIQDKLFFYNILVDVSSLMKNRMDSMKFLLILCLLLSCASEPEDNADKEKTDEQLAKEVASQNRAYQQASQDALLASRYENQRNTITQGKFTLGTTPRIKVDPQQIVDLKKKAMKGDRDSQYSLGLCYKYALGVKQSNENAAFWLSKAADQGHYQAKRVYRHLMFKR